MSEESSTSQPFPEAELESLRRTYPPCKHYTIERLLATIAERDKALDDATVMLDVSNQQLAEIRAMVGDGPAAEAVRRALAAKDAEIERLRAGHDAATTELLEFVENVASLLGCNEKWSDAHNHRLCVMQAVMWGTGGEERVEVRKIVEARENESTPDAVHRALKELFAAYSKEMDDVARVAIEQIEGALHDGAIGMRDACLILVRAAGQGQPRYIAAAMDALRRSIETLLV